MKRFVVVTGLVLLSLLSAQAQGRSDRLKPQWLRQVPASASADTRFVVAQTYNGPGVSYADEMGGLVVGLPSDWRVSTSTAVVQVSERTIGDRRSAGVMRQTGTIETKADGLPVSIRCARVDSYEKGNSRWALYQVAKGSDAVFADCVHTDRYGAAGGFLSIIPGCGQFYKGDPLKGTLFLGGCAAGGLGIVFTEMQRQAYRSQIGQTLDVNVIRQLDAKCRNLGIARNVCIGATAAVYLWNIIDGAVAPGAKRIVFTGNALQYNF